jgi:hypothetical protein
MVAGKRLLSKYHQIGDEFTAAGRCLAKTTHESIPCILTESWSSLKNLLKMLRSSDSGVFGMSFIISLRTIAATFLTYGMSS